MSIAEDGGILVSATVKDLVLGSVSTSPIGGRMT